MSKREANRIALEACKELIKGDGTADSLQRAIDLANAALDQLKPAPKKAKCQS